MGSDTEPPRPTNEETVAESRDGSGVEDPIRQEGDQKPTGGEAEAPENPAPAAAETTETAAPERAPEVAPGSSPEKPPPKPPALDKIDGDGPTPQSAHSSPGGGEGLFKAAQTGSNSPPYQARGPRSGFGSPSAPSGFRSQPSGMGGDSSQDTNDSNTKLFIGNLPTSVDEDGLRAVAGQFGKVEEVTLMYRSSPSGDRCGFVRYSTPEEARFAKMELCKQAYPGGRSMMVARYADRGKPRAKTTGDSNKLFVGNLPPTTTEEGLTELFGKHGTVEEVIVLRKPSLSGCRCAFIRFDNSKSALAAIENLNGMAPFPGNEQYTLAVRVADGNKESSGGGRDMGGGGMGGNRPQQQRQFGSMQNQGMGMDNNYGQNHQQFRNNNNSRSPGGGFQGGRGFNQPSPGFGGAEVASAPSAGIFVSGLPPALAQSELAELFAPHGTVEKTEIHSSTEEQGSTVSIYFSNPSDAERARNTLHDRMYLERKLQVCLVDSAGTGNAFLHNLLNQSEATRRGGAGMQGQHRPNFDGGFQAGQMGQMGMNQRGYNAGGTGGYENDGGYRQNQGNRGQHQNQQQYFGNADSAAYPQYYNNQDSNQYYGQGWQQQQGYPTDANDGGYSLGMASGGNSGMGFGNGGQFNNTNTNTNTNTNFYQGQQMQPQSMGAKGQTDLLQLLSQQGVQE